MGRGDCKEISAGRLRVLVFYAAVGLSGPQDGGRPADEEGEGPIASHFRAALTLLPPEAKPERIFGLRRVGVEVVLVEADDELFCLEAKAVVQQL